MLAGELQAEEMKLKGNEYFKKDKLSAAIDAYTEAIALCPTKPVYWTNRAVCFKKRNDWERVRDDCQKALELDKRSFKGNRLLGLALLHLKHYPESIRALKKALEIGLQSGLTAEDPNLLEAERDLMRAKYEEWQVDAAERREKQRKLKDRLLALLEEDKQRRLAASKAQPDAPEQNPSSGFRRWRGWRTQGTPGEEQDAGHPSTVGNGAGAVACEGCEDEDCSAGPCSVGREHREMVNTLENVFDVAEAADVPQELPDFLCCKITMELFRDPVVTPSGITYERSVILDHLSRGRKFDPLTRSPLEESELVPNLAMKAAVTDFLERHGWAHQNAFHPANFTSW